MDYFDPFAEGSPLLGNLPRVDTRFLVVSFDSDWRFPTAHSQSMARVLREGGARVEQYEVESPWGHDSFLMDVPVYLRLVRGFLRGAST
jgi:homoserine O-acetyltransferase/O-succinyltransferase